MKKYEYISSISATLLSGILISWVFISAGGVEGCFKILDLTHLLPTILTFLIGLEVGFIIPDFILGKSKKIEILVLSLLIIIFSIGTIISIKSFKIWSLMLGVEESQCVSLSLVYNILFPTLIGLLLGIMVYSGISYLREKS